MKFVLLVLLVIGFQNLGFAQSRTASKSSVAGVVVDSASGKALRLAGVSLLAARDSAYVTASVTDGEGRFALRNVAAGKYRLLVTFLGYRSGSFPLTVSAGGGVVEMGTLRMVEQASTLSEVVVREERPPVTIKQDTVEFNASSFKTQPNAQVEELLRKLPGITVARDGSIQAQGQAVNRVLVNGKPFFGDDPKTATRNLPAGIIDKVQLYDQASDQSQFTGIDDGNRERTLNLTIRPDKSRGYFGQNSLGIGTKGDEGTHRYAGRLSLNRFNDRPGGKTQQLSLIGQANNLNQQSFTVPEGAGGGPGGGSGLVMNGGGRGGGAPQENQNPSAIVETRAGGLNYRGDRLLSKGNRRLDVVGSYFLSQAITTTDQQIRRESSIGRGVSRNEPLRTFLTDQANFSQNRQLAHRVNARIDWQIDSLTSLRFTPNLSAQTTAFGSRVRSISSLPGNGAPGGSRLLNTGLTDFNSAGRGLTGTSNLLLMRRFRREGRTFSANLNTLLTRGTSEALNQSSNTFYDSTGTGLSPIRLDQRSEQLSSIQQQALTLAFTEPLSLSRKAELRYVYSTLANRADRDVNDVDEHTGLYTRPNSLLSNQFGSLFATHQWGGTIQTRRLRYTYALGLTGQQSHLQTENHTADTSRSRVFWNVLPNALFSYTFPRNRTLRLQYRTRLNAPSLAQLQPAPDNTNPLNIRLGNPNLSPEFYNTFTLLFNGSSRMGTRSFMLFASLNQSNNRIATSTTTKASGAQSTRPVNLGGYWSANGVFSIGRTLQATALRIDLNTNAGLTQSNGLINGQTNTAAIRRIGQGFRVQSTYNGRVDFGLSGTTEHQAITYSIVPNQNTSFWTHYATADLHWQLPGSFVLTSDLTYTATTGRATGYNQQFALWNLALARQFLKTKQAEFRVQVFDVLNQNRSLSRTTTEAYIEDVNSTVLRPYVLLSFVYNLRKFGS